MGSPVGRQPDAGVGGYETEIGTGLQADLSAAGITPGSTLDTDISGLLDNVDSYSGFHADLVNLQSDLLQTAFSDLLGIFSGDAGGGAGAAAADLADFWPF